MNVNTEYLHPPNTYLFNFLYLNVMYIIFLYIFLSHVHIKKQTIV